MDYPNVGHSPFSRRVGDRCVAALGIPAQQPFLGEWQASKILRPPSQRYVLGLGGNKLGPAERIMRCWGNTKMVWVGPTVFAVADPTQSKVGMAYVPAQGTALALKLMVHGLILEMPDAEI